MEAAKSPFSVLLTRLAIVAALAAAMLATALQLGPRVSFWQQERLAMTMIAELEQTASPQIQVVLKQVSSFGNPAIEPLVLAAASERADIALAARRIIEENIAAWQIQVEQDEQFLLEEPTGLLAAALAAHVDKFGAFGQQWAARLTLDIVDLAGEFSVEAAVPVLADCSKVLSSVQALGPRMLTPADPQRLTEPETIAAAMPKVRVPSWPQDQPTGLPRSPNIASAPAIPGRIVDKHQATQELLRSTAIPRASNWVPEWAIQPKLPVSEPEPSNIREATAATVAAGDLVDVPSPEEQAKLIESLRTLETRELLVQFEEGERFKKAAVREVLAQRGIVAEELALASRLFAEDTVERLKLVDDLKVLPARTARRWLRELVFDKDAEVRLKALTALATTKDPELRSIAHEIAVRDTDRRVAELASQIMREMR